MAEKLGISTGKGFHKNLASITSIDVPIGSIVVSKGHTIKEVFTVHDMTFYFTHGTTLKSPFLYEDETSLDIEAEIDFETATMIKGKFILCGSFQDAAYTTGMTSYMRIWQRIG